MRVLLDENMDVRLKSDITGHEVSTVRDMGWLGKTNGELLELMVSTGFEVLITADKNVQHQQNFSRFPIPVIVVSAPRIDLPELKRFVPRILELLSSSVSPGVTVLIR